MTQTGETITIKFTSLFLFICQFETKKNYLQITNSIGSRNFVWVFFGMLFKQLNFNLKICIHLKIIFNQNEAQSFHNRKSEIKIVIN